MHQNGELECAIEKVWTFWWPQDRDQRPKDTEARRRKDQEAREQRRNREGMRTCSRWHFLSRRSRSTSTFVDFDFSEWCYFWVFSTLCNRGQAVSKWLHLGFPVRESELDSLHCSHQVWKALHSALVQSSEKQIVRTLKVVPSQKD